MARMWARTELDALIRTLDAAGPGAPTLCAGWDTADLLAHLVSREHAPWEQLTSAGPRALGHDARTPAGYDALLDVLSAGPPAWSPMAWAWETLDHLEYLVHHEDVRRAAGPWEPRVLNPLQEKEVWRHLVRGARLLYRREPAGVVLRVDGLSGRPRPWAGPGHVARRARGGGEPTLTVSGHPVELAMHAFGRRDHALVRVERGCAALSPDPPTGFNVGGMHSGSSHTT